MQRKQHGNINGCPGGIKERKNAIARQELPHLHQITKRPRLPGARLVQISIKTRIEHTRAQSFVQPHPRAHQHA